MVFNIITIFPRILDSYLNESILKRAGKKKLIKINFHDPRIFAADRHKTVDGRPFGGGPGMLMKIEPLYKSLKKIKRMPKSKIILFDPSGTQFNQKKAEELSRLKQIILICGRYEGIDARLNKFIDEKVSIGPYVLSGGELPAAVVIESVSRLLPGVLGNQESLAEETFNQKVKSQNEYPQYTRPEVFEYIEKGKKKKLAVPKILLSGNHAEIKKWREKHQR